MKNMTLHPRPKVCDVVKESHHDVDESPPVVKTKRISYPSNIDFIEDLSITEDENKDEDNRQLIPTYQQPLTTPNSLIQASRLPTPRTAPIPLPHSNSFFSNLAKFSAKSRNSTPPQAVRQKLRRVSGQFPHRPKFLTRNSNIGLFELNRSISPCTSKQEAALLNRTRRSSNFQVAQRKLMAPLSPATVPRSNTLGSLPVVASSTEVSPSTPRYALPTNASRAKSKTPTSDPLTRRGSVVRANTGFESPMPSAPHRNRPRPTLIALEVVHRALDAPPLNNTPRPITAFPSPRTPRDLGSTPGQPVRPPLPGEVFRLGGRTYIAQTPRTPTSAQPILPPTNPAKKPLSLNIVSHAHTGGGLALTTISPSMVNSPSPNISTISFNASPPTSPSPSTPTPILTVRNLTPIASQTPISNTQDPRFVSRIPLSRSLTVSSTHRLSAHKSSPTNNLNRPQVSTAMPPSYWLGRYTSLSNRFRTESLSLTVPRASLLLSPTPLDTDPNSSTNPAEDEDVLRMRRAFAHLMSFCTTEEARTSLTGFRQKLEKRLAIEAKSADASDGEGKVDFGSLSGGKKGKAKTREGAKSVKDAGRDKRGVFERLMTGKVFRERRRSEVGGNPLGGTGTETGAGARARKGDGTMG
ncbi:MAG: hypothetical protein MMC33_005271 [Icmadophila ericetorum]|nr:hypothetical protein [Icmadophila ericetorum]